MTDELIQKVVFRDAKARLRRACNYDVILFEANERDLLLVLDTLTEIETRLTDLQATFDLQHSRMGDATDAWRRENYPNRELQSPDLGELLEWLMNRHALAEAQVTAVTAVLLETQKECIEWKKKAEAK